MQYLYPRLLLALMALLAFSSIKAQQKKNDGIIPIDPAVRTGKLVNGFTYYIRHNEVPKNRVIFYLANKVGSILEDEDQRGLAHFVEHMSFNGTKHFPKNALVDYLQKAGVRFGADINAFTGFDETVYQLPIPSDNPALLQNGIEIMHDWAQGATLDPAEIIKERGVILEEKRSKKGFQVRMRQKYWPTIFNNSRYATRTPIGADEVLNNFKPEAIRRFYHDWYRPDLQALIIVGDINVDELEKIIKDKFADLKNPVKERPRVKYAISLTGKNQFISVTDPEMTATVAEVIIKQPELPLHTTAEFRQAMIRSLFNTMIDERYEEQRQQSNPSFISAGAEIRSFYGGLDNFYASVMAAPGDLEKGFKSLWRETERAKRFGFNRTELERAKTSYLNQVEAVLKEKNKTSSETYAKTYQQHFLTGVAAVGIDYEYKLVKNTLLGITVQELNALAKTAVKANDRDILILAPEKDKASLPDQQLFDNWIKAVETERITAYRDETSKEDLLTVPPVSGRIIGEKKQGNSGMMVMTLNNGVRVLLKPTNFKDNEIQFTGFSSGGTSLYSDAEYQSAKAANRIPSFGVGNYNATQLSKYLSGRQLNVEPFIDERFQGITGVTANQDLETALQLVYGYFTAPRKDSLMFQGMIARQKANMANRLNNPENVFQDTISAVLGDHNTRRTSPSLEKMDRVNLDSTYSIYKERFANASGFSFIFVGSLDTPTIKPLLEKYLGGLPATGHVEQAKDLHIETPAGIIEKTVQKGSESKATVKLVFSGAFDYNFENKIKIDALGEVLNIRLLERLREDEGGVYSPHIFVMVNKYPQPRFNLSILFTCAPQNVDKLITSTLDEIKKIRQSGPLSVNVDKFKAESQRHLETTIKTNDFWLSYLNDQLQNQDPLDQIDGYSKQINLITSADIKDVAGRYLSGKNYIKLVLLPENK